MRPIPNALKSKLLNRVKSEATDSMPLIRLVATQTSSNVLLSEPIHTDILPAIGDVAVRQTSGEREIALAYAICLDDGIAKIYQRQLPAGMDYPWEYLWTFGPAEDVAIEFDGEWKMNAEAEWYYLETEQYPYIFYVQQGNLYVQKWNDPESAVALAYGGVTQLSACKGWKNSIDQELDQGLIIGYIRNGEVFYRSLCMQENGNLMWEAEHSVSELGNGNSTLSVFRTNDFRIGFLTENDGEIQFVLTYRNYAGMSVRPETIHVNTTANFLYLNRRENFASMRERSAVSTVLPYFSFEPPSGVPEVTVVNAEKINRDETFFSYGTKMYLDQPIEGTIDPHFLATAKLSVLNGTATSEVKITDIEYDPEEQALIFWFASDIRRTCQLTITTTSTRYLWYERLPGQKWFIPAFSAVLPMETERHDGYDEPETLTVTPDGDFWIDTAEFHYGVFDETMRVSASGTVVLEPVSSLPI